VHADEGNADDRAKEIEHLQFGALQSISLLKPSKEALPVLMNVFLDRSGSLPGCRFALRAIGRIGKDASPAIPTLLNEIYDFTFSSMGRDGSR
jgi:hypothetical protein